MFFEVTANFTIENFPQSIVLSRQVPSRNTLDDRCSLRVFAGIEPGRSGSRAGSIQSGVGVKNRFTTKLVLVVIAALLLSLSAFAHTSTRTNSSKSVQDRTSKSKSRRHHRVAHRHRRYYERFYTSSYVDDPTIGDVNTGEDATVRAAAVDALGNMNGTVVAIDPSNGRILAMVNQQLALSAGAEPCSTIKVPVTLAALSEHLIDKDTPVQLGKYWKLNLTHALAISNNNYFEAVGRMLGWEKYSYYARQFGLGELAGYNIPGEHLGEFPTEVLPEKDGGVGKMCSFGESISMTPLQLGALVSAIANGGTLYYLQHPITPEEVTAFRPVVKRQLDIAPIIPQITEGMAAAVQYGTARTVHYNFTEEQVMGKTGTCSKDGTRFGWFASFANTQYGRIVVVVFLRGGRPTYGPKAAEIAGRMYRNLYDHNYFEANTSTPVQAAGASQ